MAQVLPFECWRPSKEYAAEVAAAPYDTVSRDEAAAEIAAHPLSFMRIDKPAALFGEEIDEYDPCVYERARQELALWYQNGVMQPHTSTASSDANAAADTESTDATATTATDATATPATDANANAAAESKAAYFIYRLTQGAHCQTGIMACVSVDDYKKGVIKRHENTRMLKEDDRVEHIKALDAHTGPVLLTYPGKAELDELLECITSKEEALYDFVAPDGVRHEFWCTQNQEDEVRIGTIFKGIPTLYIADGHHRAAAAARICKLYGSSYPQAQNFLALIVGSNQMQVLDYNRLIRNFNGLSPQELLAALKEIVAVEAMGVTPYKPAKRGEFGMYAAGEWYKLTLDESTRPSDVVTGLDVAVLHDSILQPVLGIDDPRSNPRIAYVGGIRGLDELAQRADKTGGIAFALYPCSLDELFAVADADLLMPPKSTWFEPKPRSGLAVHRIGANPL